jgi:gas vesicle protein
VTSVERTRLEQLVWRAARSRRAVAVAAAVLLVLCFVAAVATGSPGEPSLIAYAIPVSLAGIALGARGGMAAAVVGGALYWLGAYFDGRTLSAGYLSYRLAALVFLGGIVGALSSRLAEAEQGAQLEQELRSRAVELNDTVVQGLALSRYQLAADDTTAAAATLAATLERAQELVADLMGDVELEAGALRRARPADVGAAQPRAAAS